MFVTRLDCNRDARPQNILASAPNCTEKPTYYPIRGLLYKSPQKGSTECVNGFGQLIS